MTTDVVALDRDIGDLAAIDVVQEVRKGEGGLRSAAGRGLEEIEECDEKQPDHDPQGEILAEIVHSQGLSMPSRAPRAAKPYSYSDRGRPANIFARSRDKMLSALNNCKACPAQRIDRPEDELRQCCEPVPLEPEMRNGCEALLVPDRRQNRIEQPGQAAVAQPRRSAVQLGDTRPPEIADGNGGSRGRQRDGKAAVP